MNNIPVVGSAAAAAILSTRHLSGEAREGLNEQRYYVHPHVEVLSPDAPALLNYLGDVYSVDRKPPIDAPAPQGARGVLFRQLSTTTGIVETLTCIALGLQQSMESKAANPGILFGFSLIVDDGTLGYGVIKADLEDDKRFFVDANRNDNTWSLSQVEDILPPPQTKYAKYAISPRPLRAGAVGIRDSQAGKDSAASYFLQALGLIVSRRSGTQRAIATLARRSGHEAEYIEEVLSAVDQDISADELIRDRFSNISEQEREKLVETPERPMPIVYADDPYCRKYFTRHPRFELTVDRSVRVNVQDRTITVVLPPDADEVEDRFVD